MKLEQATGLDRVSARLQRAADRALGPKPLRDVLHGVWLGHPLHPALVELPIGAWVSAAVLDLTPGQRRGATVLVATGTAAAVPTMITGLNDWASLSREQRRVGLVHAASNTIALMLYSASLFARLRGRYDTGRTLGFLGLGATFTGAYLGGHLAYRQAAGVNQSAPSLHRITAGWHPVADLASLPEETLVTKQVDEVPVLVYRDGQNVTVMLARCAHQNGPLDHGMIASSDGHACVVCPWHGSTFRLSDGTVAAGPAATDQQVLRTRVVSGMLEAELP
ncbi:Ferredoxin subunit of nitrite reductase or a ring-hydroxylating dioxygenase [Micromonospora pattaloongensis]|uniref:Ferredoxin subunit of nitrite reductase or a ring-hydroxylating dioxygenase n=1 Tax=Micromonospora pattaloongensis TaxID=405436 RepID=A0A1H3IC44_9ACTN|nr:Rieske 2Fe-2S domain-containing protein [Micromonospora pattaloongensis]SDY25261.1 Ferredoxin subunit of nitrite reductase or a ring-hydroxylating dioxygenase [Micromonospora pattaloongensis]